MDTLRARIIEKLEHLPETSLRSILSYAEFLSWKSRGNDDPLLSVAASLTGSMPSAEEIEEALYGDRMEQ